MTVSQLNPHAQSAEAHPAEVRVAVVLAGIYRTQAHLVDRLSCSLLTETCFEYQPDMRQEAPSKS